VSSCVQCNEGMAKKQKTLEGLEDDGGYVYLFIFNINILKLFRKNIKKLIKSKKNTFPPDSVLFFCCWKIFTSSIIHA
jgi:hypothetical protein